MKPRVLVRYHVAMLIGYARVSTVDQDLSLQIDALNDAGCEKIFRDTATGATVERPSLHQALKYARKGDTVLVWRLDRLGRSLRDLIDTVETLNAGGIGLRSLQESIDTTTSGGRLIFHVFGALAEFERCLVRERTHAGLEAARARGRMGGRPRKLSKAQIQLAHRLYAERKHTLRELCTILGVSRTTLYAYLRRRDN